jgi:hypothetical protein
MHDPVLLRGETTGGGDTPVSISSGISIQFLQANFEIFECLGLKSNSCREKFDKFTKILLKKFTNCG